MLVFLLASLPPSCSASSRPPHRLLTSCVSSSLLPPYIILASLSCLLFGIPTSSSALASSIASLILLATHVVHATPSPCRIISVSPSRRTSHPPYLLLSPQIIPVEPRPPPCRLSAFSSSREARGLARQPKAHYGATLDLEKKGLKAGLELGKLLQSFGLSLARTRPGQSDKQVSSNPASVMSNSTATLA